MKITVVLKVFSGHRR